MGEDCEVNIQEMQEMIAQIKDTKILRRLSGIMKLQIEKEQEESNIVN
jgi:muramoyltetrapeptide carboxypeptidase LdcA involved in peptidoglycan recycling